MVSSDVQEGIAPEAYFRRDQNDSVTAPDLSKTCTFSEHIVHARGKRTKFTSLTLDLAKCRDFGEASYRLLRPEVEAGEHKVIEHNLLIEELRLAATHQDKDERLRAIQAIRYATKRKEGLVDWRFDIARVPRKEVISWAHRQIQPFFEKV